MDGFTVVIWHRLMLDGYYSIVGRSKDLIISGGFNVYPSEVERVLLEIDGIQQVAVVGLPSDEWGEVVVAVVIGEVEWSASKRFHKPSWHPISVRDTLSLSMIFHAMPWEKYRRLKLETLFSRNIRHVKEDFGG